MAAMPRGSASAAITVGGGRIDSPLAIDQSLTVSTRCSTSVSVKVGGYVSLVRDVMLTVVTATEFLRMAEATTREILCVAGKMDLVLSYFAAFVGRRQKQMVELRGLLMRMSAGFGLVLHNETDWRRSRWTSASPKNSTYWTSVDVVVIQVKVTEGMRGSSFCSFFLKPYIFRCM